MADPTGFVNSPSVHDGSDEAASITSISDRLWIGSLSGFTLIVLFWAFLGRIPETVPGKGLLIGPGNILRIFSEADGTVKSVNAKNGDRVNVGDSLVKLEIPDLELNVASSQNLIDKLDDTYMTLNKGSNQLLDIQKEDVAEQIEVINRQISIRRNQANNYKQFLENSQNLRQEGGISEQDVLSAERDFSSQLESIESLQIEKLKLLENKKQLNLQNQEQRLSRNLDFIEKRSQATLELNRLKRVGDIEATTKGTVFGLSLLPGDLIQTNQLIATLVFDARKGLMMDDSNPNKTQKDLPSAFAPNTAVIFFRNSDSHLLKRGDELSLTPEGFSQEEFGGIRGKLISISTLPSSRENLIATTGSSVQAEQLIKQGLIYSGVAKLDINPSTQSGYDWTGGNGPKTPITFGSSLNVNATLRYRAPVSYIFPFLREWTGLLRL